MNGEILYMETNVDTKDKVKEWDDVLDQYEKSIGLGSYTDNLIESEEINKYFSMNRDVLEKLTPEDTAQIAYRLAQFAFHIQRTLNREIARHNWAEESIKEIIADDINNYKGYGYIEKYYQAVKHNDAAAKLQKIKKYAKQRMDRLSYMANSTKNLSDILLAINRNKVKNGHQ